MTTPEVLERFRDKMELIMFSICFKPFYKDEPKETKNEYQSSLNAIQEALSNPDPLGLKSKSQSAINAALEALNNPDPYKFFTTKNQSKSQKGDHLNSFYSKLIDRKPEPSTIQENKQLIRQLAELDRELAERDRELAERDRELAERDRQLAAHSRELKRYKSKEVAAIEQRKAAGKSSAKQRQATIKSRNQTWIEEAKRLSSKKGGTSVAKDIRKSKLGLKPESFERYSWQTIYQAIKGHL